METLIYVSDLGKSIGFYGQVLGFRVGDLYPDEINPTYAPVFAGGSKLMLCAARESNRKCYPRGLGGSGVQFFVKVDDVDAKYNELKVGAEIVDELETKSWGDREFTIKDPDGYLISLYSPTE